MKLIYLNQNLIKAINNSFKILIVVIVLLHFENVYSKNATSKSITNKNELTKSIHKNKKLSASKSKSISKVDSKKNLSHKLSFNDRMVNGKHQVPGEGLVTVENEKPVFNLLSIRSDFKDRREKEKQRE